MAADPQNRQPTAAEYADFDRELDLAWRRTSYSALTAAAHGADAPVPAVGSEPELNREDDESAHCSELLAQVGPTLAAETAPIEDGLGEPSPMHDLPSGAEFGTAVHAVFERVDADGCRPARGSRQACAATLAQGPATAMTAEALASALLPAFRTPLGPLADEQRLCDIPRGDRLAELSFEYPLTGGDTTNAEVTLGMVSPLLRRHLSAVDPLADYPDSAGRPGSGHAGAARLSDRQHRCRAPDPTR